MNRDLVVVRAGRASRHPEWLDGAASRPFDLVVCPFQDGVASCDRSELSCTLPGQKWSGLHAFLTRHPFWRAYERIWLPDDDLRTRTAEVARFFDACRRLDAALAQPALVEGSEYSHLVTLRNRAFSSRATTFVEVMAPCFRRDVLERLLPTFVAGASGWGWGLDYAWARVLEYRGLFVVDDVPVLHDRPVGSSRSPELLRSLVDEQRAMLRRFDASKVRKTLGGTLVDGTRVEEAVRDFLERYLDGYRWLTEPAPSLREALLLDQRADPTRWLTRWGRRADPLAPRWWERLRSRGSGRSRRPDA